MAMQDKEDILRRENFRKEIGEGTWIEEPKCMNYDIPGLSLDFEIQSSYKRKNKFNKACVNCRFDMWHFLLRARTQRKIKNTPRLKVKKGAVVVYPKRHAHTLCIQSYPATYSLSSREKEENIIVCSFGVGAKIFV